MVGQRWLDWKPMRASFVSRPQFQAADKLRPSKRVSKLACPSDRIFRGKRPASASRRLVLPLPLGPIIASIRLPLFLRLLRFFSTALSYSLHMLSRQQGTLSAQGAHFSCQPLSLTTVRQKSGHFRPRTTYGCTWAPQSRTRRPEPACCPPVPEVRAGVGTSVV